MKLIKKLQSKEKYWKNCKNSRSPCKYDSSRYL